MSTEKKEVTLTPPNMFSVFRRHPSALLPTDSSKECFLGRLRQSSRHEALFITRARSKDVTRFDGGVEVVEERSVSPVSDVVGRKQEMAALT